MVVFMIDNICLFYRLKKWQALREIIGIIIYEVVLKKFKRLFRKLIITFAYL